MGTHVSVRRPRYLLALYLGAGIGLAAGSDFAFAQQPSFVPATTVRDNIATTIQNIRLLRGAPEGTVSCQGNRGGVRPTIRCDVRYVDSIAVTGIEITERDNPANIWTASFRPFMHEEDETAYLLLVDRSDADRAASIRRSAQDLAELFSRIAPKQRVAVAAFDSKLDMLQEFTTDGKAVASALDGIRTGANIAELYRLSLEAVRKLGQQDAPRKVLVIVSDGKFDDTVYKHEQVAQEANRLDVRIVTIGYHNKAADMRDLQSLRRLSADTHGFFFETPGGGAGISARGRHEFFARMYAGAIIEAEALARGVPPALQISLRHPQGAATSFTVLLHPGVATPESGNVPTTPMDSSGLLYRVFAWLADDLTRAAAILAGIAVLLFGFLVSGFAWRSSVRGRQDKSRPPSPEPAPVPASQGSGTPPTLRAMPAPPTEAGRSAPLAWLEFNGVPGTVPVYKNRISIGRETDNDVVTDVKELAVSRHHAVITMAADGSFQIANRSAEYRSEPNPILINGTMRESGRIADGDVIKLGTGNYGFLFRESRKTGR